MPDGLSSDSRRFVFRLRFVWTTEKGPAPWLGTDYWLADHPEPDYAPRACMCPPRHVIRSLVQGVQFAPPHS